MAELGQIQPEKKIACSHCSSLLTEDVIEAITREENMEGVPCSNCGQLVRLPRYMIEKLRSSKYLGKSLDITI